MSNNITAADTCVSSSYEVQQLSRRVASCSASLDELLAKFWEVQMLEWKSPAGQAYRTSVGLQSAALGRARERLELAASAVLRHSQLVSASSGRMPGGGY